jgi:hypothetical protein
VPNKSSLPRASGRDLFRSGVRPIEASASVWESEPAQACARCLGLGRPRMIADDIAVLIGRQPLVPLVLRVARGTVDLQMMHQVQPVLGPLALRRKRSANYIFRRPGRPGRLGEDCPWFNRLREPIAKLTVAGIIGPVAVAIEERRVGIASERPGKMKRLATIKSDTQHE